MDNERLDLRASSWTPYSKRACYFTKEAFSQTKKDNFSKMDVSFRGLNEIKFYFVGFLYITFFYINITNERVLDTRL